MTLESKTILIVGGSSGIGFAVAKAALAQDAEVVIASSHAEKVDAAVLKLGRGASGVTLNVEDKADIARALAGLELIDHLVYTAGDWGGPRRQTLAELDLDAARRVFAVRFWGALTVVKALLGKIADGGSIVLTDGMVAHRPSRGSVVSTAMAGSIEHLVRGLAVELAPIRVNGVCPGMILTGVWDAMSAEARDTAIGHYTRGQPLPRAGLPEEVAEAYIYLMRAGYTTGQILRVDGGGLLA